MTTKMLANIQEETGKTVADFTKLIKSSKLVKHGEIRNYFKNEHGLSYGFANTLAHVIRDEIEGVSSGDELVDAQYNGKEHLKPIYDKLTAEILQFGKDVELSPKKSYVSLRRKKQFGLLQPSTKKRFDVGIILKGKDIGDRLEDGKKWNGMCTHRVRIEDVSQIDEELISWLKEAYEASG